MNVLVLAVAVGLMGGAASASVITLTGTGVFDLVETGIQCRPCGPADAAPLQITRTYTVKLNDEVRLGNYAEGLRWFKYNRNLNPGDTFELVRVIGYSPPETLGVNINSRLSAPIPGYQFSSDLIEYRVVLSRGPAIGSYALESISVTGPTVSDSWDVAVIGDGASRAYLQMTDPEFFEIARYSGTVDWTLDVSPIPLPAAAPLLAAALGLLAVVRRRRKTPS